MRVWTMRDLPGLMDNVEGAVYALHVAIEEGSRSGVRAAVKALGTLLGVVEECVEEERRGRRDE